MTVRDKLCRLLDLFEFPHPVEYQHNADDLPLQGIYLLWNRETDELEYIGKSIQIWQRLAGHEVYCKERHRLEVIGIHPGDDRMFKAQAVEVALIGLGEPKYNRAWNAKIGTWKTARESAAI